MRKLDGISESWHRLVIPDDLFQDITHDFTDLLIIGITPEEDTITVPYHHRILKGESILKPVSFELINQTIGPKGYFYTFKIPVESTINQISLDFEKENFDWRLTLAGSHGQREWFTITEDYRMISISDERTQYRFTDLLFDPSDFTYYRIQIHTQDDPGLLSAQLL
ncbi:hypothetical protein QLX67_02480, partial [Balneolaceae bacterium ANBcel3]|nr:hypothetical protein [Balneolaceae bacterium ANBcel3]